jgi:HAE1 family hydrophobic/amphiphilic exporter-1
MLCSNYLHVEPPDPQKHHWMYAIVHGMGTALERLDGHYQKAIAWALHHRKTVVFGAAASFAVTLLIFPYIGVELVPQTDEGQVNVNLQLPQGTVLEVSDEVARRAEETIRKEVPELDGILVQVGGGGGFQGGATNNVQLQLRLKDRALRQRSSQQIAQQLNEVLNVEPGVTVRANPSGGMFTPGMGGGSGGGDRASVEVRGYDIAQATLLAQRIQDEIQQIPGIQNVRISRSVGVPELLLRPNRVKAALFGLNVSSLGDVMGTALGGRQAGLYREGGREYNILVRLQDAEREQLRNIDLIPVTAPVSGATIPAGSLITKQRQEGPVGIDREDRERIITVSASFTEDRDLGSVMRDIQAHVDPLKADLPPNFAIIYGGEYEDQQESFRQLMFALLLAVLLVYMVMAAQYESWRDPLIILFSIPLAAVGVTATLLLTGTNLSIQAFLGIIMLAGISVSNAILLVDYTNILQRRDGLSVFDAVTKAGRTRLRPILMTTATTILGLLPMAFGLGEGGEVQAPMARVVIGGMITSTAITLLFIPTLYAIAEERSERRRAPQSAASTVPLDRPLSAQGD